MAVVKFQNLFGSIKSCQGISAGFLFLFGSMAPIHAADLQFTASVDRTTLSLSETVTLTLRVEGSISGAPQPKLPDLSDFRVLSGPNESSNFQFINGRMSFSKSWSFVLRPRRSGTLTIGAAELSVDNRIYRTDPVELEVNGQGAPPPSGVAPGRSVPRKAGQEPPELYVQVSADKTQLYQNEQVVLTYTIFTRVSVSTYEISRLPATPGFWTEEFDLPTQPAVDDVVISGRHYRKAVIRRAALFPAKAGELVVDPLEVTCQVQVQDASRRTRDPFDMLFDSPFMRQRTEERFIETEPLKLKVLPLPAEGRPEDFSGAVGDFNLDVSLDRERVQTNEALTMMVRFSGAGNVKFLGQPDFKAPSDFESYEPKETVQVNKTGRQITGTKTYEYVLIPRVPGIAKIPPVEFAFFNPASRSYKTLTKGGFEVTVDRGSAESMASLPGIPKEEVKLLAEDIRYLKIPPRPLQIGDPYRLSATYRVGMALPPLIAFMLWGAVRVFAGTTLQNRRRERRIYARAKKELHSLSRRGSDGKAMPRAYGAIHRILITYLGAKLGLSAAGLKEEEVLSRLANQNLPEETVTTLQEIFQECNFARFAPEGADSWHLNRILKRSDRALDHIEENWGKRP